MRHRTPGRQHRIQHHDRLGRQIRRQRLQIGLRLVGGLVAGDADEAHPCLRDERVCLIDHAQPRPQYRHQQRRIGQSAAGGLGQGGAHRNLLAGRIPGGLVNQHQGQIAQRRPKRRVVGALVTQRAESDRGQRVVDDTDIHARTVGR